MMQLASPYAMLLKRENGDTRVYAIYPPSATFAELQPESRERLWQVQPPEQQQEFYAVRWQKTDDHQYHRETLFVGKDTKTRGRKKRIVRDDVTTG